MSIKSESAAPVAALVAFGLAVALYVYRPWVALPFDVWDFREFVPLLRAGDSVLDQFRGFLSYYASQGRHNPLLYATIIAQWHLFGEHTTAWMVARFALMCLNAGLLWLLFFRLGMTRFGAAAGVMLFVGGSPMLRGWVQLLGEPQALTALVLAAIVALRYQAATHWLRRAVLITLLLGAAMFIKEILGVIAPLVVLLAWSRQPDGRLALPRLTRRNVVLGALTLAMAVVAAGLLVLVRQQPQAVGYGMSYGSGDLSLARFADNLLSIMIPVRTGTESALALLYPANLVFLVVVLLGWLARFREAADRRTAAIHLLWIAALPVLGAVVYLPWPKFDSFYGLPFFVSSGLLFGCAISALQRGSASHRILAHLAPVVILLYSAIGSRRSIATATASLQLNAAIARGLSGLREYDSVVVVGPRVGPRAIPVKGTELRAYAIAMRFAADSALPVVGDADCEGGTRLLESRLPRTVLLTYSYGCGRVPQPSLRWRADYSYRDWLTLAPVHDSLTADLLIPR